MAYGGWNLLGGYRLLDWGQPWWTRLRGEMDFNTADGFGDWVDFSTRECEGLRSGGGSGALRKPIDSNRSFPVMSTLAIVLAALEIFRHIVLLWIWVANLWLGYLYDHICYEFCELLGCE